MNDEPITSTNGATTSTEGSTSSGVSPPAVVGAPNGVTMTKTEHKSTRPRGAKGAPYRPHARRNYRNAAPRSPTPRSPGGAPEETTVDRLGYVGYSAVGAAIASVGGVLATRLGFHPRTVAIVLGATGVGIAATTKDARLQRAGAGAFSAGGSQLLLLAFRGQDPAPKVALKEPQPAPRPRSADIGALPPGALDAAFERARASLAIDADSHMHGHGY